MSIKHCRGIVVLLAGLSGACHSTMPVVAVKAEPGMLTQMSGAWEGSYESEANGREGTIRFELTADGDTARGEVMMLPAAMEPYQGSAPGATHETRPLREPVLLQINFVEMDEGQILGTLAPYIDPDCDCRVTTNFIGSIDGDSVRGIFAIRGMNTWLAYGEWRAHRVHRTTR